MPTFVFIDGASASSRRKTLMNEFLEDCPAYDKVIYKSCSPQDCGQVLHNIKDTRVLVVAKSLGAVSVCEWLRTHSRFGKYSLQSWRFMLIDPHKPCVYNHNRPINVGFYDLPITCIYQHEKWPKGAIVRDATNIKLTGVDHFSIVKHPVVHTTFRMLRDEVMA